jgi:mono/diheme cytochrome c family protein
MKITVPSSETGVAAGANADATRLWIVMAAAVLALATACTNQNLEPPPTAGTAAPSSPATFTAVVAIFVDQKNNCRLCHMMPTIGGGLVFDPMDKQATFQALVGTSSKGTLGSQCGGKTYVVPRQPDASLLYDKISKTTPTCGMRMPATGTVLTDPEIATVRAWIAAGAMNN